jgi:HSP20 family protein
MPLDKWNPLKELESMRKEMDRIWEDLFPSRKAEAPWKRQTGAQEATVSPAIDIIDRTAEIVVRAEMPGVAKDDIDISLQDGTLTIKGEVKEEAGQKEGNYTYSERNYRYYARSLNIPFKIKQDGIKATLKDGVLSVQLPKVVEEQPRKITVDVS